MNKHLEIVKRPAVDVGQLDVETAQESCEAEECFGVDERNQCPHAVEEGVGHPLEVLRGLSQSDAEHLLQHGLTSCSRRRYIALAQVIPGTNTNITNASFLIQQIIISMDINL